MIVETIPRTCEAIRFTVDNVHEVKKFVEFTGHRFSSGPHPFILFDLSDYKTEYWIVQRPGVILTVAKGEWLVYNLSDATWRIYNDKEFNRHFKEVSDAS